MFCRPIKSDVGQVYFISSGFVFSSPAFFIAKFSKVLFLDPNSMLITLHVSLLIFVNFVVLKCFFTFNDFIFKNLFDSVAWLLSDLLVKVLAFLLSSLFECFLFYILFVTQDLLDSVLIYFKGFILVTACFSSSLQKYFVLDSFIVRPKYNIVCLLANSFYNKEYNLPYFLNLISTF